MSTFDSQFSDTGSPIFETQSYVVTPTGPPTFPVLRVEKVVGNLPSTIEADTIYVVRVGTGFDLYVSDSTGAIAHSLNLPTDPPVAKSVTLDAPTALERIILFNQKGSFTVSEVRALLPGGSSAPSVTFNIGYGPDVSLAGTELWGTDVVLTNTTTGVSLTAIDNPTIPDTSWVWLAVKAVSGVVPTLHLTMKE